MATCPRSPDADGDRQGDRGVSYHWERCTICGQLLTPRETIRCRECIREEPQGFQDDDDQLQ